MMRTILCLILSSLLCTSVYAQSIHAPGNTCQGANLLLKKDTFTVTSFGVPISSSGITPTCFNNGPANGDMWYKFNVMKTGILEFKVSPLDNAEFDFALYDITDGCPDVASGTDVASKEKACNFNFSGPGNADPVGMLESSKIICPIDDISGSAEKEFCQSIQLEQCKSYAIMIENFSGVGSVVGFTFELGGSFEVKSNNDTCIVGVNDYEIGELNVYPNPAENSINVSHFFDQTSKIKLSLVNSIGQIVFEQVETVTPGNWKRTLDIESNAPGVYILRMELNNHYLSNKILINKNLYD